MRRRPASRPDVWRYYLLKNRPESGDTQFEWRSFIESNNSELLAKLGNFVNRIIKLVNSPKAYSGDVPSFSLKDIPISVSASLDEVTVLLKLYLSEMEAVHLRNGLLTAMKIAEAGNGLIQLNKLDNALIASQPELAALVTGTVINLIYLCSAIFEPYLPDTCKSIRQQLNVPFMQIPSEADIADNGWLPTYIKPGHKIGKAEYLFSRIDEKKADEWKALFGGNQEERRKKQEEEAKVAVKKALQKEKAKAKKAEKKGGDKGEKKTKGAGVEAGAKGGEDRSTVSNPEKVGEDAAVNDVTDGIKQITIPTS